MATFARVKAAWIRNDGYPAGKPAPGHFICNCGERLPAPTFGDGAPGALCPKCGIRFNGGGWIVERTVKYQFFLNVEEDEHGRSIGMMDGYQPNHKMNLVDAGEIVAPGDGSSDTSALDGIYYRYNMEHPANYRNRSMSVGDVIVLGPGTPNVSAWAVSSFGFAKLESFNFEVS